MLNCEISNIVIYLGKWVEFFSKNCRGSHMAFLALWWLKWQIKIYDEETLQSQVKKTKCLFLFTTLYWIFFLWYVYFIFFKKYDIFTKIYKPLILWFQIFTRRSNIFSLLPIINLKFSKSEFSFSDISYFYYVFPGQKFTSIHEYNFLAPYI